MGRTEYLAMKTDQAAIASESINSDFKELKIAAKKLANDAMKLGGLAFGTTFFQWLAAIAAIYLLILDRTNWKTETLTSLLVPYIFFSLPSVVFSFFRGDVGKWIAIVTVVLRLFFPKQFPDWLEVPGAVILVLVVAPSFFADYVRGNWIGVAICLAIGCYLLQEHIRKTGGFRAFTESKGILNTIGIVLLMVYPVWALVLYIL